PTRRRQRGGLLREVPGIRLQMDASGRRPQQVPGEGQLLPSPRLHHPHQYRRVGGLYLLRCVEASEAVGDPGRGHLEQPAHVSARPEGGSVAFRLLHVCPCRVSNRSLVFY
ncbi:unnamed protein product, partial [Tetraodon nigroviridis]